MKIESFLDIVRSLFAGASKADAGRAKLDRGILDVAMMIAAVDGEILPAEIAAYNRLLNDCRGMLKADVPAAADAMLKKVNFLMTLKNSGISDRECVISLVREAKAQLPADFANCTVADRRCAFVFWTIMSLSDGCYSPLEHAAVRALAECFAADFGEGELDRIAILSTDLADPTKQARARMALEAFFAGTADPN